MLSKLVQVYLTLSKFLQLCPKSNFETNFTQFYLTFSDTVGICPTFFQLFNCDQWLSNFGLLYQILTNFDQPWPTLSNLKFLSNFGQLYFNLPNIVQLCQILSNFVLFVYLCPQSTILKHYPKFIFIKFSISGAFINGKSN